MTFLTERFGHSQKSEIAVGDWLPVHDVRTANGVRIGVIVRECWNRAEGSAEPMSELAELLRNPPVLPDEDNAKRRQIVDGARQIFLARGFDAASMMEIARTAGVSKGTLYVYFKNKEELFAAIVENECRALGKQIFDLEPDDHDVGAVLSRLGTRYVEFLVRPTTIAPFRTVIAIAERMPEIGRQFYETGP